MQRTNHNSQPKVLSVLRAVLVVLSIVGLFAVRPAASGRTQDTDFSKFNHSNEHHASQACSACHVRAADNSVKQSFPGHPACTGCHLPQFVNTASPMCTICHADMNASPPSLKAFPTTFKEKFNVKFDHAQHMNGSAKPAKGCSGCHDRPLNRGVGLSIPSGIAAHSDCYSCHTPSSRSSSGKDLGSCGSCHDRGALARVSTAAPSFKLGFSHGKHGPRQRLDCIDCHKASAGAQVGRQVNSPKGTQHFPSGPGQNCATCHNGKKSFGGDVAFDDCKRCHTGSTFRAF